MCKKLIDRTPFWWMYEKEVFMHMEYIIRSLRIIAITEMKYVDAIKDMLLQLIQLEEEHFVGGCHQNVENKIQKVWHDRHIKNKQFQVRGLVLMYDRKFFKNLGNLKTHWLGLYIVKEITYGRSVKLKKLDGTKVRGLVNGS